MGLRARSSIPFAAPPRSAIGCRPSSYLAGSEAGRAEVSVDAKGAETGWGASAFQLGQDRQQGLGKAVGVFREREMPDALHRLEADTGDLGRGCLGQFHGARVVVFARQHEQPASIGIDARDAFAAVPLAGIKGDVAKEDLRAALAIVPR